MTCLWFDLFFKLTAFILKMLYCMCIITHVSGLAEVSRNICSLAWTQLCQFAHVFHCIWCTWTNKKVIRLYKDSFIEYWSFWMLKNFTSTNTQLYSTQRRSFVKVYNSQYWWECTEHRPSTINSCSTTTQTNAKKHRLQSLRDIL